MSSRFGQELLFFCGGFDPPYVMSDTSQVANVLAFMYPAPGDTDLKARLGTVDFE
jgi:hypothetical protein